MRTLVTFWGIAGPLLLGVVLLGQAVGNNEREMARFRAQCHQNWADHNGTPINLSVKVERDTWCRNQWALTR